MTSSGAKTLRTLPYNGFSRYVRRRFGGRIQKIPLDAGFGCPHRSGKDGRQGKGCIFCENRAFSPSSKGSPPSLAEQIEQGIRQGKRRYRPLGYMAYFQAYTNTFGPPTLLRQRYDIIRNYPEIVGLAVGTRPDCAGDQVLDLLEGYCSDYEVWLEYGLQSGSNETLRRIRRGHSVEDFVRAVERTARHSMLVCAHVVLGLPGEGHRQMMDTAQLLAGLPIQGVKIHHCHVIRGTPLAEEHARGRYHALEYERYLSLVCDFLEILPWPITIHRLMGEAPDPWLVAPRWSQTKADFIRDLQQLMARKGSIQGSKSPDA